MIVRALCRVRDAISVRVQIWVHFCTPSESNSSAKQRAAFYASPKLGAPRKLRLPSLSGSVRPSTPSVIPSPSCVLATIHTRANCSKKSIGGADSSRPSIAFGEFGWHRIAIEEVRNAVRIKVATALKVVGNPVAIGVSAASHVEICEVQIASVSLRTMRGDTSAELGADPGTANAAQTSTKGTRMFMIASAPCWSSVTVADAERSVTANARRS